MKLKPFVYRLMLAWSLLLIPLVGSLVTQAIHWSVFDYFVAALLLGGSVWGLSTIYKAGFSKQVKRSLGVLFLLFILLLWSEMAVGLFGSPLAGS